jgi:O-antigen/teichoic acid export membrane protein
MILSASLARPRRFARLVGDASTVRRVSSVETAGDLLYRVFMAGYWVLLSRTLTRAIVGDIAFANALAVPLSVLVDSGFTQYLLREYRVEGDVGLPRALRSSVTVRYTSIVFTVVAITAGVALLGNTRDRVWIGGLVAMSYGLDAAGLIWLTRARAHLDASSYFWVRVSQSAGVLVLTALLWTTGPYTAVAVCATSAAVYIVAAGFAWSIWRRGPRWRTHDCAHRADVHPRRHFATFAIFTTIYSRLDAIVVQLVLGSIPLATYALAFKLVEASRVLPGAVARAVLASSSKGASSDHPPSLPSAIGVTVRLCVAMAVALAVAGPSLMKLLFGSPYAVHGTAVIRILALTLPALGLTAPVSSLLLAWRKEHIASANSALTLACTAVFALSGAFLYGLPGIAGGVLLGEVVSVAQYFRTLSQITRPRLEWRTSDTCTALLVLGAGLICATLSPFSYGTLAYGLVGATLCAGLALSPSPGVCSRRLVAARSRLRG